MPSYFCARGIFQRAALTACLSANFVCENFRFRPVSRNMEKPDRMFIGARSLSCVPVFQKFLNFRVICRFELIKSIVELLFLDIFDLNLYIDNINPEIHSIPCVLETENYFQRFHPIITDPSPSLQESIPISGQRAGNWAIVSTTDYTNSQASGVTIIMKW